MSDHSRSHQKDTVKSNETKCKIAKSMVGNKNGRVLSDEQIAKIHELREQGLSQQKIADMVGSNKWTVGKILRGASYIEDVV